jgi:hypothetical protein
MGNDEVHIGILRRQHVHHLGPADHIDEYGQAKPSRRLADFPRRHGIKAVHFDAAKIAARP